MSIIAFPRVLSSRRWRSISLLGATIVLGWLAVPVRHTQSQATVPDYKNAHLPVEQRVSDLLSRMTLEEKLDLNMRSIVEPGWFDIMVGTSSVKYQTAKLEVVAR